MGKKSKIIPIARWLSHCMLWMMGYDYNCVIQELYDVVNGSDSDSSNESSNDCDISDYNSREDSSDSDDETL